MKNELILRDLFRTDFIEPFDILYKNLFDSNSNFLPFSNQFHLNHPADIYEEDDGLHIDVAAVGANIEDIEIEVKDREILIISHQKIKEEENGEDRKYLNRNISKKSFNLAFKIARKFDLDKVEAILDRGLLQVIIPIAEEKPEERKLIEIKNPKLLKKSKK
jgi:HSP20 family molecular chaperone IbpA